MNYECASDRQIEVALALALGYELSSYFGSSSKWMEVTKDGLSSCLTPVPDYCSSWSDMGEIIHQNGISLIFDEEGVNHQAVIGFSSNFGGEGGGYFTEYEYEHKNILRAAAIVYLMYKESE